MNSSCDDPAHKLSPTSTHGPCAGSWRRTRISTCSDAAPPCSPAQPPAQQAPHPTLQNSAAPLLHIIAPPLHPSELHPSVPPQTAQATHTIPHTHTHTQPWTNLQTLWRRVLLSRAVQLPRLAAQRSATAAPCCLAGGWRMGVAACLSWGV